MLVRLLFAIGIVLAAVVGFLSLGGIFPWIVGGTGIVTGFFAWKHKTAGILITAIALVVALSAIIQQEFNPAFLTRVVFFIRVFVAHVALAAGALTVFLPDHR
jgi:hypothetical protein